MDDAEGIITQRGEIVMSNRDRAVDLLQMLPEQKVVYAMCFLEGLSVEPDNTDTDPFYCIENQNRLKQAAEEMLKTGGSIHEVNLDD